MLAPSQRDYGSRYLRESERSNERPWHSAREGEVVVVCSKILHDILLWEAIGGNVMGSLNIEGLFNFGVRSY